MIMKSWFNFNTQEEDVITNKSNLITFEELRKFKIGEVVDLDKNTKNSITATRIKACSDSKVSFRVTMKKDYVWSKHVHDCDQTMVIYKGSCTNTLNNTKATKSQYLFIPAGVEHELKCDTEELIFYVEFKKR